MTQDELLDRKYLMPPSPFRTAYEQLRPVEREFVDGYVEKLAKSAIKAGKRVADYLDTARPAGVIATEFLSRPLVCAAIRDRCDAISKAAEVSSIRALMEVKEIAYSNIGNFLNHERNGFDLPRVSMQQLSAVKKVKFGYNAYGPTQELEMHAKQPALDLLCKFLGLDQTGVSDPKIIDINPNVRENAQLYAATLEEDEE